MEAGKDLRFGCGWLTGGWIQNKLLLLNFSNTHLLNLLHHQLLICCWHFLEGLISLRRDSDAWRRTRTTVGPNYHSKTNLMFPPCDQNSKRVVGWRKRHVASPFPFLLLVSINGPSTLGLLCLRSQQFGFPKSRPRCESFYLCLCLGNSLNDQCGPSAL